jgi:hypothetical protein
MEKMSLPKGLADRVQANAKGVPAKKEKHLHSEAHVLADELSSRFGEPKRFGLYLRLAKQYNHGFLRRVASEVFESRAKNPGALFSYLVKKQKDQLLQTEARDIANHNLSE